MKRCVEHNDAFVAPVSVGREQPAGDAGRENRHDEGDDHSAAKRIVVQKTRFPPGDDPPCIVDEAPRR